MGCKAGDGCNDILRCFIKMPKSLGMFTTTFNGPWGIFDTFAVTYRTGEIKFSTYTLKRLERGYFAC